MKFNKGDAMTRKSQQVTNDSKYTSVGVWAYFSE